MLKRFVIAALSVSVSLTACVAQDKLVVISTLPLPEILEGKLATASSPPACEEDGNMSIYADEGDKDAHSAIYRLSPNGDLLADIDTQKLPGFTDHTNYHFAPGPNGEVYFLLQNGYPYYDEEQKKVVVGGMTDRTTELLRLNSAGDLISRVPLQAQSEASNLAVFSDGSVLVIEVPLAQRNNRRVRIAKFFPEHGEHVRDVVLPAELSSPLPKGRRETLILVTMTVPGTDEVWIVRVGYAPVLAALSAKGEIRLTTKLKVPDGFKVNMPRFAGGRLFTGLFPTEGHPGRENNYAAFDTHTGDVVQRLIVPGPRGVWHPICDSHNGMYFINSQERTLNVVAPAPQN